MFREKNDKKNFILLRSSHCFAVFNTFPYNNGHLMVILNRHTAAMEKLRPQELSDIMETTRLCVALLKKTVKPDGFNIGMNLGRAAGAGVASHIHMHIVPRWGGDTNFMPVCADTKIISQSLDDLWRQLTKKIPSLTGEKRKAACAREKT